MYKPLPHQAPLLPNLPFPVSTYIHYLGLHFRSASHHS
uniref:Uncharacterized protein n=1 Tax=Arundo donax TaxID=35708 RepID=A0A0A9CK20_ARUDO